MRWMVMTGLAAALALPTLAIEAAQMDPLRLVAAKLDPARPGQTPVDAGPRTPDADAAHRGGGVILEGKPGGTAPEPRATAPVPAGGYAPLVVGPAPAISR